MIGLRVFFHQHIGSVRALFEKFDVFLGPHDIVVASSSTKSASTMSPGKRFKIRKGETLGVVGESGCGKYSTGRAIIQLPRPSSGTVRFEGVDLTQLKGRELRKIRQRIQMIFQDPISSLNPRRRVRDIVSEPLVIAGIKDKSERELRCVPRSRQ